MPKKVWYETKHFWFGVLYVLVGIAGLFGYSNYQPTPDVQQWLSVATGVIILVLGYLEKGRMSTHHSLSDDLTRKIDR